MFPPPTTIAVSTPRPWSSTISSAMRPTCSRSIPNSRSPINASPESFRRTRLKLGFAPFESAAKRVPLEGEHLYALFLESLADGLAALVDPLLIDQHALAEEALAEHPLDDLLPHLLGLRLHVRELLVDRALALNLLGGDLLAAPEPRSSER